MKYRYLNKQTLFVIILAIFLSNKVVNADIFSIRTHTGIGLSRSDNSNLTGTAHHAGARFLLQATNNKKFGIETSWINLANAGDMFTVGIVLENRLQNWFHMSIGTVGYFNFANKNENPVGLTTNLGWEPANLKFKPLIALRNDLIFHKNIVIINSISFAIVW